MRLLLPVFLLFFAACSRSVVLRVPQRGETLTGSEFYRKAADYQWQQRDSLAIQAFLTGNFPGFLKKLVPVTLSITDSINGKTIRATCFVSADYFSIGTERDWARVCLSPLAAQRIADSLGCFLPTRKLVDEIYRAATVKPEPVPMYAYRDSTPTMWQHHLIIEGQRRGKKGLIAGIKKDLVITGQLLRGNRTQRVAIYGWHKANKDPIQPLYTGHHWSWVDYSQGFRLVWRKIRVDGNWMDYTRVLEDPVLRRLICDEPFCDFFRY